MNINGKENDMGYNYEKIKEYLKGLDILYKVVEHEPAYTTEEADKYIEGHTRSKNKNNVYM